MCGRFTLTSRPEIIAAEFGLPSVPLLEPRYNVAPTQAVAAVRLDPATGRRRLDFLRWGLVPPWADDPSIGNRLINARAETVAERAAFRQAFMARRTLIAADAFYGLSGQFPFHFRFGGDPADLIRLYRGTIPEPVWHDQ
jgi:putative SOS response-associated peptidase YedK